MHLRPLEGLRFLAFLPIASTVKKPFDNFRFRNGTDCIKIANRRFYVVYFTIVNGNISVNLPLKPVSQITDRPAAQGGDGIANYPAKAVCLSFRFGEAGAD